MHGTDLRYLFRDWSLSSKFRLSRANRWSSNALNNAILYVFIGVGYKGLLPNYRKKDPGNYIDLEVPS